MGWEELEPRKHQGSTQALQSEEKHAWGLDATHDESVTALPCGTKLQWNTGRVRRAVWRGTAVN